MAKSAMPRGQAADTPPALVSESSLSLKGDM